MPEFLIPLHDDDFPTPVTRNYKGLSIVVETPKGSVRQGIDEAGDFWSVEMKIDYGFIENTISMEGEMEGLDCFVDFDTDSEHVFICRQLTREGNLDEEKVFLGFTTANQVRQAYAEHYNRKDLLGQIEVMDFTDFVQFLDIYHRPRAERAARDQVIEDSAPRLAPPNLDTARMFGQTHVGVDVHVGTRKSTRDNELDLLVPTDNEPHIEFRKDVDFIQLEPVVSDGGIPAVLLTERPMKRVGSFEFPAEAFAVIVDFESPDLWQILIWESPAAKETPESVRRAVDELSRATLSPDFMNVAKSRILKAFKKVMPLEPVPSILL